jgi:tetratricopeptide (TPR) repeat protein
LLELVVETLGGDAERFHQLWLAATRAAAAEVPPVEADDSRASPRTWVPHELPADQSPFIGRSIELAELDALLGGMQRDADSPGSAGVAIVAGSAGAGKTTTAVHWGHRVAARFPDGQIYLNLRGYDPMRPVAPTAALEAILGRLGVEQSQIPWEQAERAALYRTVTAGRRMLIVLDNAHTADQVRDLLPGTPGCFVIITSRDSLTGLVARHGASRVELDRLPEPDATRLLAELIGPRAVSDPDSTRTLARRCARLPLALRVAAEVAAAQPSVPLANLLDEFAGERLDLLAAGGDQYTAVRSVFSWSLAHLSPAAVRLFALGGQSIGRDLDRAAVVALGGHAAATACDELIRAHLLEQRGARYAMHDLLREYAIEVSGGLDPSELVDARGRLFDYYAKTAAQTRKRDDPAARVWLERERANLIAGVSAAAAEWPAECLALADALSSYLDERGYYAEGVAVQRIAVDVARDGADRTELARALNHLAAALRRTGPIGESLEVAAESLMVYRELGDDQGAATVEFGIATVHFRRGENQLARTELLDALDLFRRGDDRVGEARTLNALGITLLQLGRLGEALANHEAARTLHREVGDRTGEGRAYNNIGVLQLRLGDYDAAETAFDQARQIATEQGNRAGVAVALANSADVAERQGRLDDAVTFYGEALQIYDDVGHLSGRADATRGLGVALAGLGRTAEGIEHLKAALKISRLAHDADVETSALNDLGLVQRRAGLPFAQSYQEALARTDTTGDAFQRARALQGLAFEADSPDAALALWQQSLSIFAELGVPEADEVRTVLAELGLDESESARRRSASEPH